MQALPHDGVNRFQGWESRLKIPIPYPWPSKNPICPLGGFFFLFFPDSLKAQEYLTSQAASPWRREPAGASWSRTAQASRMPDSVGRFQTPGRPPLLTFFKAFGACFSHFGGLFTGVYISFNEDKGFCPLICYKG